MARLCATVRVTRTPVVRESDGRTFILVAAYLGKNAQPSLLQVIDPHT